jgi:hypothetical protein
VSIRQCQGMSTYYDSYNLRRVVRVHKQRRCHRFTSDPSGFCKTHRTTPEHQVSSTVTDDADGNSQN